MPTCAMLCCKNRLSKIENDSKITYHSFPADPITASKWIEVVRESRGVEYWKPSKSSIICSAHFHENDMYLTQKGYRRIRKEGIPKKALNRNVFKFDETADTSLSVDPHALNPWDSTQEAVLLNIKNEMSDEEAEVHDLRPETSNTENSQPERATCGVLKMTRIKSTDEDEDSSDLDSYLACYDSPLEAKLRKEVKRLRQLKVRHVRLIKTLHQKIRRFEKRSLFRRGTKTLTQRKLKEKITED